MFLYETIPLDWSKTSIEGWWRSTRKKSTKGSDFFWTGGGAIGHPWIFIPMSTKAVCLFVSSSTNKPSTFRPQDGPLGLSTYFLLPNKPFWGIINWYSGTGLIGVKQKGAWNIVYIRNDHLSFFYLWYSYFFMQIALSLSSTLWYRKWLNVTCD